MGGTTLSDTNGNYWNATNDGYHASALSYIPETTWNDTVESGTPSALPEAPAFISLKTSVADGIRRSADGWRDVPDIAMPASADHDPYLGFYTSGVLTYGGTSVSSPVFAGIAGLLNQYQIANGLQKTAGQGNMNPRLYSLAANSSEVFHDTVSGNNMVPSCSSTQRNCIPTQVGFSAGPGYDQTTGLGSVDAFNLISAWAQSGTSPATIATVQLTSSANPLPPTGSTVLTATVTAASGATPTGTVTFYLAGAALGSGTLTGTGLMASATLPVTASQLTVGPAADPGVGTADVSLQPATAVYSGDSVYATGASSLTLIVVSPTATAISGTSSAASFFPYYAPGMIMSMFDKSGHRYARPARQPASDESCQRHRCPERHPGTAHRFADADQFTQIPYEVPVNSTLNLSEFPLNGQTSTSQICVRFRARHFR